MAAPRITLMVNYSKLRLSYSVTLKILLRYIFPDPDRRYENRDLLKKRDESRILDQTFLTVAVLQEFLQIKQDLLHASGGKKGKKLQQFN